MATMTPRMALMPGRLGRHYLAALGSQLSVTEGQEMAGGVEPFGPAPLAKAAEPSIVILKIGCQHAVNAQPANGRFRQAALACEVAHLAPIAVIHLPGVETAILGHAVH